MKKESSKPIINFLAMIIGGVVFIYFLKYIVWWVPSLATVVEFVKLPLKESFGYRILGIVILSFVSLILVRLKDKLPVVLGLLEFVAGVWTILITFEYGQENNLVYSLSLGGGVFLLINGFEKIVAKHSDTRE